METAKDYGQGEQNPIRYNKGLYYNSTTENNEIVPSFASCNVSSPVSDITSAIVVDYLELHCESVALVAWLSEQILENDAPECVYKYNSRISFHYHGMGTKVYKYLITLQIDNQDFALLQVAPRKVIGKITGFSLQLKVINEFLYKVGTYELLKDVLDEEEIKIILS